MPPITPPEVTDAVIERGERVATSPLSYLMGSDVWFRTVEGAAVLTHPAQDSIWTLC
jgi:hypothetical protein